MCGIAGLYNTHLPTGLISETLQRMAARIVHRGPDESGIVPFERLGAGLAVQRLSIVGVETGHQPMSNEDGSVWAAFNGEIYNHTSLRKQLEARGHHFRSDSDTEVIVHLFEDHGPDCLKLLEGMFGLGVIDLRDQSILLARDRAGMKPLYYAETPAGLVFASEAKSIFASGLLEAAPDWTSLDVYLSAGFVPSPATCFRGICRLPAGGFLRAQGAISRKDSYWRPRFSAPASRASDQEYAEELERLLRASVQLHLKADVTVGSFLSGGWDSSLITLYAAEALPKPLKTYSLVLPEDETLNEVRFQRIMASHAATDHHEVEFRAAETPDLLPKMIEHLEEPCAIYPALLGYKLSRAAARDLKCVVSGEGADELFAGYIWLRSDSFYPLRRLVPRQLAQALSRRIHRAPWSRILMLLAARDDVAADLEWMRVLKPSQKEDLFASAPAIHSIDLEALRPDPFFLSSASDHLQRRLAIEISRRLADGLLFVQDKMSMANSLELRMPFLHPPIVDFALSLPSDLKIRNGQEKFILSKLAERLPPEIAQRKKQPFRYPRNYLSAPAVQDFSRDVLLRTDGLFERRRIEVILATANRRNTEEARLIWTLVVLQLWWDRFISSCP
ncbi:MAG: asparagine synthase (glutamine-hydrolyzing) [Acidimicrobiia bacterium]|nr:asparagine synthase (glutamine-hydrolyzing) [Acidimicrobiia bacterium]